MTIAKGFVIETDHEEIFVVAISPEEAMEEAKSWLDAETFRKAKILNVYNEVYIKEPWRFS